jgi:hypothetical protein
MSLDILSGAFDLAKTLEANMKRFVSYLSAVLLTVVSFTVFVAAQVTGGAVTGSVVDANGAVIPDARVVLKDKLRGQEFSVQTTGSGSYQFPNVGVGEYTMTITKGGFSTVNKEIVIALNQTTTVDATLSPAGVAPNVVDVVGGETAVIKTDTSQLGNTFGERKVLDLPTNGNANNLALLAPNVVPPANGTAGSGGVSGGVRARGNSFNIDGVDNNDASVTGPSTAPIQDAVQEFTLLQNNFSAEFGAGAGGQFNQITKSGTNEFHGSLFTYIQSQRLNARSTDEDFGRAVPGQATPKNYNKDVRYGFTLGGPMPFFNFGENDGPMFRSGKNKLFFFGAYEKYFQEGSSSPGSYDAPTTAGLAQLAAIPGVSPFVLGIFQQYVTLPTTANPTPIFVNGVAIPFGTVSLPIPAFQAQNSYQFNIDHLPNEKNQFRYRFSRTRYAAEQAGSGGLAFNNNLTYDTDLFSVNWIRPISSNLVNDLRLSYLRTIQDYPLKDASLGNFPNITVAEANLTLGPNGNLPQSGFDNNYQLYNSLTWIKGSHTVKFGGDYRRYIGGSDFLPRSRGDYSYSNFEQLVLDQRPGDVNIKGIGSGAFISNNHRFFTFVQDDWKIRPNLTLNLGLRYEFQGLYRDAALQATAAPANVPGVIEFNVPETDKNNFAPRIGFAYAPSSDMWLGRTLFGRRGDSSIRANFSRAFFPNFSNFALISLPPTLQGTLENAGPATNFLANGGAGTAPFVPNLTPAFLRAGAASYILPQIVPYVDSISVSYQRSIGANNGMEIRYLRTRGKQLPVQTQLNSRTVVDAAMVIPTFFTTPTLSQVSGLPTIAQAIAGTIINPATYLAPRQLDGQGFGANAALTGFSPLGKSKYDGVAFSFNRRFTRNVGFTAAYTFSKTEDNSTNELNTSALNPRRAQDAGEYFNGGLNIDNDFGLSVLDIPHRFVTSFNIDIPFFNNSSNGFLKAVFGGFQVNGIYQIQSGQPITIQAARDVNRNGDAAGDRALVNPNGNPNIGSDVQGVTIVNGAIVLVPVGGTPNPNVRAYVATNPNAGFVRTGYFARELANNGAGTVGRNTFRTQGFSNTDLVILKNTRFGTDSRFNFQVGAEIFDLFNQREQTITGVGAFTQAFAIPGNANFQNYGIGSFAGRSMRMRAKFIF